MTTGLMFSKAGIFDALILNCISKQSFDFYYSKVR